MSSPASRLDPQVRAALDAGAKAAAAFPPLGPAPTPEAERALNEAMGAAGGRGGPKVSFTEDRWIAARGRRIFCRLHKPRTDKPLPVALYFHGGGWFFSSVDTHDNVARNYAVHGDVAVISVDYALSPEAKFPQALMECAAVARHIAAHGADWGLDASRLLLCGDSAGGNLALATALVLRDQGGPPLRGVVTAYPVCDSDFDTPSYSDLGSGLPLTADKMKFFWDAYVATPADLRHPLAAVLRADLAGLPPVLIHVGELDVLLSECAALADKLTAAGVDTAYEALPGLPHGFMRLTDQVDAARAAAERAGAFIRRRCA